MINSITGNDPEAGLGDAGTPLSKQSEEDVARACMKLVKDSGEAHDEWREEAKLTYDFRAGHQWDEEDLETLREQDRPPITFNQIGPFFNTVTGAQINNRQKLTYLPSNMDTGPNASEPLGLISDWAADRCDKEDEESEAFRDCFTCGMGWTETYMSYYDDPLGMIMTERVHPLDMFWDASAARVNLADAKGFARRKIMSEDEVVALWPDAADKITIGLGDDGRMGADEPTQPVADSYAAGRGMSYWKDDHEGIAVYCFEWREIVKKWVVPNPAGGGVSVLSEAEYGQAKQHYLAAREVALQQGQELPPMNATQRPQRCWYRAHVALGQVLDGINLAPCPERSSFKPITGYKDERDNSFYGLVRPLIDPQRWANKWLSQSLHIMNTAAKSGYLIEENAVRDLRKFEETVGKPGSVNVVNQGVLAAGKIMPKEPPQLPEGHFQLMQFAIQALGTVSGINDELRGAVDRDQPGIVEWERKRAATVILAPLFDSMRRYYKEQGRLWLYFLCNYIPPDRMIRVAGPSQQQRIVSMGNLGDVSTYDVSVDEAPMSPHQKQDVWNTIGPAIPTFVSMGLPPSVWITFLKYSPLPESVVMEIEQDIQQAQQTSGQHVPPEVQKAQAMAQVAQQKAQNDLVIDQKQSEQAMQLAQLKAQHDATLAQQKARLDAELEQQRAAVQMQIERAKSEHDMELRRHATAVDTKIKLDQGDTTAGHVEEVLGRVTKPFASRLQNIQDQMSQLHTHVANHGKQLADITTEVKKSRPPRRNAP